MGKRTVVVEDFMEGKSMVTSSAPLLKGQRTIDEEIDGNAGTSNTGIDTHKPTNPQIHAITNTQTNVDVQPQDNAITFTPTYVPINRQELEKRGVPTTVEIKPHYLEAMRRLQFVLGERGIKKDKKDFYDEALDQYFIKEFKKL